MKSVLIAGALIIVFAGVAYAFMGSNNSVKNNNTPEAMMGSGATSSDQMAVGTSSEKAVAVFGDGCFWCVEHDMAEVKGVINVVSGYAGGTGTNPTYQNYAETGFREVVEVTYNPQIVSYANLVEHIIKHGDPTDAGGSFHDRGPQYVPAIYYSNDTEKADAQAVIAKVDEAHVFPNPLPLLVIPHVTFYPAEDYHQDYSIKNPLKYAYYRAGSGRTGFIDKTWGRDLNIFTYSTKMDAPDTMTPTATTSSNKTTTMTGFNAHSWDNYVKPSDAELMAKLTPIQYKVSQKAGTEPPHTNEYDSNFEAGIYVDVVSGEPLYFSKDKFDSGTGWPSFVKPISPEVVTLKEDNTFFSKRTEVLSAHSQSHVGHVFNDGPPDRGGMRYCMNSAAMHFIPKADMEKAGYGYLLSQV
jgi:peptide methionine sulfoxide reductase msrA/msrB